MEEIKLIHKETGDEYKLFVPDSNILSQLYNFKISDRYSCQRLDLFKCEGESPMFTNFEDFICSDKDKSLIKGRIKIVSDFFKTYYSDYLYISNNIELFEENIPDISDVVKISKDRFIDLFYDGTELYNFLYYVLEIECTSENIQKHNLCQYIGNSFADMPEDSIDISMFNIPAIKRVAIDILQQYVLEIASSRMEYKERRPNEIFSKRYIKSYDIIYQNNIIYFDSLFSDEDGSTTANMLDIFGTYQPKTLKLITFTNK